MALSEKALELLSKPYVVVVHKPTGKAFSLARNYTMFEQECEESFVQFVRNNAVSDWDGWFPTMSNQIPDWAAQMDSDTEFKAYWLF